MNTTEQIMQSVEDYANALVLERNEDEVRSDEVMRRIRHVVAQRVSLKADIEALVQERDALKVNLHQVSLSHSHLHAENKVLRDALDDLLTANSYYFPVGNPWGDRARAALTRSKS
jgi:uncharacterized protein (DUF3084 family)